jgi:hypothetical protein
MPGCSVAAQRGCALFAGGGAQRSSQSSGQLGEVLVRARYRTKKEIAKLVRELAPLPDVPARVEPLGPAKAGLVPSSPTWQQWAASLCPVRELAPGDRPADWVSVEQPAPEMARVEGAAPVAAQRYRVEFTASEEYVSLVERARALLSHAVPNAPLEAIHLQALRLLVAEPEKRKYAVTARPAKGARAADPERAAARPERAAADPERRKRYLPAAVRHAAPRDPGRPPSPAPVGLVALRREIGAPLQDGRRQPARSLVLGSPEEPSLTRGLRSHPVR